MTIYLEHANITVPDIDQAIAFLQVIEPDFYVRQDESPANGHRWAHIGNEHVYIALQESEPGSQPKMPHRTYENYGINHLGWVVDDLDVVIQRLEQQGYQCGLLVKPHRFRKRAYYYDKAGFEWELIQYLSNKDHERNIYEAE
jgi:catechol 2,3-dioxygenase-like lactoylglutathione lyase family enzyme